MVKKKWNITTEATQSPERKTISLSELQNQIRKDREEKEEKLKQELTEKIIKQINSDSEYYFPIRNTIPKANFDEVWVTKLWELLTRIGKAESVLEETRNEAQSIKNDVNEDKREIERIESAMLDKFKIQFSLITTVLVAIAVALIALFWQTFWMYPWVYKDYITVTEKQNSVIENQGKEIEQLKKDLWEIKSRLEREVDRRILLEVKTNK